MEPSDQDVRELIDRLHLGDLEREAGSGSDVELLRRRVPEQSWRRKQAWTAAVLLGSAALLGLCGLSQRSPGAGQRPAPGTRGADSAREGAEEAHVQQLDQLMQSVFGDNARPVHTILTITTTTTPYGWVPPITSMVTEATTPTTSTTAQAQPTPAVDPTLPPPTVAKVIKYQPLTVTTTSTTTMTQTETTMFAPLTITVTSTYTGPTTTGTSTATTTTTVTKTVTSTTTYPECAPGATKEQPPVNWCNTPVEAYPNSTFVKEQCSDRKRWQELARKPSDTESGCQIDPVTRKMKCERHEQCGDVQTFNWVTAFRELTYACGGQCEGAVLINCCRTCSSYASNPGGLGMDKIVCQGCEEETLQKVADEVDCETVNGQFECKDDAACQIEAPPETCVAKNQSCEVYECDNCNNEQLKASCCEKCLDKLCDAGGPGQRILCQGCGGTPDGDESHGWWPFR